MCMNISKIDTITQRTLEEQILDRLREAIIDGVFEPGSQLNQAQVAAQFGTSRGPIRAALRSLEEEGLVRNIPHIGTFVTELNREVVHELYNVRAIIEAYAVQLAALNWTEEDLECMNNIMRNMQQASIEGDTNGVVRNEMDMHRLFVELSGNQVLLQVWSQLQVRVRWALSIRHRGHHNLQEIADSHRPLLEKIKQKDSAGVAEVMRLHIIEAGEDMLRQWKEEKSLE